jgi:hypothetical protein
MDPTRGSRVRTLLLDLLTATTLDVQRGSQNERVALDFMVSAVQHHNFLDTDPNAVAAQLRGLAEKAAVQRHDSRADKLMAALSAVASMAKEREYAWAYVSLLLELSHTVSPVVAAVTSALPLPGQAAPLDAGVVRGATPPRGQPADGVGVDSAAIAAAASAGDITASLRMQHDVDWPLVGGGAASPGAAAQAAQTTQADATQLFSEWREHFAAGDDDTDAGGATSYWQGSDDSSEASADDTPRKPSPSSTQDGACVRLRVAGSELRTVVPLAPLMKAGLLSRLEVGAQLKAADTSVGVDGDSVAVRAALMALLGNSSGLFVRQPVCSDAELLDAASLVAHSRRVHTVSAAAPAAAAALLRCLPPHFAAMAAAMAPATAGTVDEGGRHVPPTSELASAVQAPLEALRLQLLRAAVRSGAQHDRYAAICVADGAVTTNSSLAAVRAQLHYVASVADDLDYVSWLCHTVNTGFNMGAWLQAAVRTHFGAGETTAATVQHHASLQQDDDFYGPTLRAAARSIGVLVLLVRHQVSCIARADERGSTPAASSSALPSLPLLLVWLQPRAQLLHGLRAVLERIVTSAPSVTAVAYNGAGAFGFYREWLAGPAAALVRLAAAGTGGADDTNPGLAAAAAELGTAHSLLQCLLAWASQPRELACRTLDCLTDALDREAYMPEPMRGPSAQTAGGVAAPLVRTGAMRDDDLPQCPLLRDVLAAALSSALRPYLDALDACMSIVDCAAPTAELPLVDGCHHAEDAATAALWLRRTGRQVRHWARRLLGELAAVRDPALAAQLAAIDGDVEAWRAMAAPTWAPVAPVDPVQRLLEQGEQAPAIGRSGNASWLTPERRRGGLRSTDAGLDTSALEPGDGDMGDAGDRGGGDNEEDVASALEAVATSLSMTGLMQLQFAIPALLAAGVSRDAHSSARVAIAGTPLLAPIGGAPVLEVSSGGGLLAAVVESRSGRQLLRHVRHDRAGGHATDDSAQRAQEELAGMDGVPVFPPLAEAVPAAMDAQLAGGASAPGAAEPPAHNIVGTAAAPRTTGAQAVAAAAAPTAARVRAVTPAAQPHATRTTPRAASAAPAAGVATSRGQLRAASSRSKPDGAEAEPQLASDESQAAARQPPTAAPARNEAPTLEPRWPPGPASSLAAADPTVGGGSMAASPRLLSDGGHSRTASGASVRPVFGPGFVPLPGMRSAWWDIDAQVEVKKEKERQEAAVAAAAADVAAAATDVGAADGGAADSGASDGGAPAAKIAVEVAETPAPQDGLSSERVQRVGGELPTDRPPAPADRIAAHRPERHAVARLTKGDAPDASSGRSASADESATRGYPAGGNAELRQHTGAMLGRPSTPLTAAALTLPWTDASPAGPSAAWAQLGLGSRAQWAQLHAHLTQGYGSLAAALPPLPHTTDDVVQEPLLCVLQRCVAEAVLARASVVQASVVASVLGQLRLADHLCALRAVCAWEQAHALTPFEDALFAAARAAEGFPSTTSASGAAAQLRDSGRLTRWLRRALATPGPHLHRSAASGGGGGGVVHPDCFTVVFAGYGEVSAQDVLARGLQVHYDPGPLLSAAGLGVPSAAALQPLHALLCAPEDTRAYSAVFGHVLLLKYACAALHDVHAAGRSVEAALRSAAAVPAAAQRVAAARRQLHALHAHGRLALHFVQSLHQHTLHGMLVQPWTALLAALQVSGSQADLRAAHTAYTAALLRACWQHPTQGAPRRVLAKLLQRAHALAGGVAAVQAAIVTAAERVLAAQHEAAAVNALLRRGAGSSPGARTEDASVAAVADAAFGGVARLAASVEATGRSLRQQLGMTVKVAAGAGGAFAGGQPPAGLALGGRGSAPVVGAGGASAAAAAASLASMAGLAATLDFNHTYSGRK